MPISTTDHAKPAVQTLDRGIRVLEILAEASGPLSVATLAEDLGLDRTVVYRLLRTLADHRLVTRDGDRRVRLGTGLLALSSRLSGDLQAASAAELTSVAADLSATAFITVEDEGAAVCLAAAPPRHTNVYVTYRPGLRHGLDQGASATALLAGRPPARGERQEVPQARTDGYAVSREEVQSGTLAVAAPIKPDNGDAVAAIAVVSLVDAIDVDKAIARVTQAATTIATLLA